MPPAPRLLAVSDGAARGTAIAGFARWCAALAAAGVDALQVREPELDDRDLFALARAARGAFPRPGRLFVSRRFDLALAAGADGVQLPASGLPVAAVRRAVGDRLLVGRSTHAVQEVVAARDAGADFALFGPIFDTPSKRGRLAPRGLDELARAAAAGLPVVAVGGIGPTRVAAALAAGAAGVAAIRAFADGAAAAEMAAAAREAAP
jgi:thiamine-phosphate pyrophosphorylase